MKIKTRPKHAGVLERSAWIAGLQDGESARPAGPGRAEARDPGPSGPDHVKPASYVGPVPADPGPQGQQSESDSWAFRPIAVQDQDMGLTRTARVPAVPGRGAALGAALPSSRNLARAGRGYPPLGQAELEWHHDYRADEAHARWQLSRKPSWHTHPPAVALNPARA